MSVNISPDARLLMSQNPALHDFVWSFADHIVARSHGPVHVTVQDAQPRDTHPRLHFHCAAASSDLIAATMEAMPATECVATASNKSPVRQDDRIPLLGLI